MIFTRHNVAVWQVARQICSEQHSAVNVQDYHTLFSSCAVDNIVYI